MGGQRLFSPGAALPPCLASRNLIVLGSSPSALEDLARARSLWPDSLVVGLNSTPLHVPCDALFSVHQDFANNCRHPVTVSCWRPFTCGELSMARETYPHIHHFIPKRGGYTSAPGFLYGMLSTFHVKHIALCGVSLTCGGYFYDQDTPKWASQNMRQNTINQLEELKNEFPDAPVVGMSGASMEIFGGPDADE